MCLKKLKLPPVGLELTTLTPSLVYKSDVYPTVLSMHVLTVSNDPSPKCEGVHETKFSLKISYSHDCLAQLDRHQTLNQ